jgi:hypothetical protein
MALRPRVGDSVIFLENVLPALMGDKGEVTLDLTRSATIVVKGEGSRSRHSQNTSGFEKIDLKVILAMFFRGVFTENR